MDKRTEYSRSRNPRIAWKETMERFINSMDLFWSHTRLANIKPILTHLYHRIKKFENFWKSAYNLGFKVWKDFQNEFLGRLWPRVWKNFNLEIIFRLSAKVRSVISLWNTNRTFIAKFWFLFRFLNFATRRFEIFHFERPWSFVIFDNHGITNDKMVGPNKGQGNGPLLTVCCKLGL